MSANIRCKIWRLRWRRRESISPCSAFFERGSLATARMTPLEWPLAWPLEWPFTSTLVTLAPDMTDDVFQLHAELVDARMLAEGEPTRVVLELSFRKEDDGELVVAAAMISPPCAATVPMAPAAPIPVESRAAHHLKKWYLALNQIGISASSVPVPVSCPEIREYPRVVLAEWQRVSLLTMRECWNSPSTTTGRGLHVRSLHYSSADDSQVGRAGMYVKEKIFAKVQALRICRSLIFFFPAFSALQDIIPCFQKLPEAIGPWIYSASTGPLRGLS